MFLLVLPQLEVPPDPYHCFQRIAFVVLASCIPPPLRARHLLQAPHLREPLAWPVATPWAQNAELSTPYYWLLVKSTVVKSMVMKSTVIESTMMKLVVKSRGGPGYLAVETAVSGLSQ